MRKTARRAEKPDAKLFFQGERTAHNLAVNGFNAPVGEWAGIKFADAFQHRLFPVGGVHRRPAGLFKLADLDDNTRAKIEQTDDLLVECIDLSAFGTEGVVMRGIVGRGHVSVVSEVRRRVKPPRLYSTEVGSTMSFVFK